MPFNLFSIVRRALCLFLFMLGSAMPSWACEYAIQIPLNEQTHLGGAQAGDTLGFELDIPSPGLLTVIVDSPLSSAPSALGKYSDCGSKKAPYARLLEQSLSQMTLAVNPGAHRFKIGSQDLDSPLHPVNVRAYFVSSLKGEEDPDEVDMDPDPFTATTPCHGVEGEEDPDEVDIDPDPFTGTTPCHGVEGEEDPDEVDIDPDPFTVPTPCHGVEGEEDPDEVDIDPDPFTGMTPCHGVEGEEDPDEVDIDPDPLRSDSNNMFRARLKLSSRTSSGLWRLSLQARARETLGLFDSQGHRLAVTSSELQKLLLPGTYFLQVEGNLGEKTDPMPAISASPW